MQIKPALEVPVHPTVSEDAVGFLIEQNDAIDQRFVPGFLPAWAAAQPFVIRGAVEAHYGAQGADRVVLFFAQLFNGYIVGVKPYFA